VLRGRLATNLDRVIMARRVAIVVIADLSDVSRQHLHRVLAGRVNVTLDWLDRVANGLELDPAWLMEDHIGDPRVPRVASRRREPLGATFFRNVRRLLDAAGMKPLRLAKAAALGKTTVYDVVNGLSAASIDVLADVAAGLRTTPALLLL
jgi:transcriptional regulator with XRE-family HTH domain